MSSKTDTPHETAADADGARGGNAGEAPATAGLSTAPREDVTVAALGPIGWLRWFWRQLTSMRVALILLFLLSLAAIPGSLVPQTSTDPSRVEQFQADHTKLGPLYDKIGMFHVYSSVWFSAIYLLLFISLIGCIVPRSWQFVGQLRGRPPRAPSRLDRMPAYTTWHSEAAPEEVTQAAARLLRRRRFRIQTTGDSVAAEKGYLREAGNLVFHVALIVMLVAFASGQLWKAEGGKLITEGGGFANSIPQYDDFHSGSFYDTGSMEPFGFNLKKFEATYERSGPNKGTPRKFQADITYYSGADGAEHKGTIKVNQPLDIGGDRVYLLSHGYSPVVTVRDGRGKVVYRGATPFLPQETQNYTSTGVIKVPGAQTPSGKANQLGFQGFFVPTFGGKGSGSMFSQFPALDYPVLTLTAYHGDLGVDSGLPQSVYQLDKKGLKQYTSKGQPLAKMMLPGEKMTLPGGDGSITFDGVKQWASFKISHQPANGLALGGAVAALLGLAGSLFIQRRRVWVRSRPVTVDGRTVTVVEMAGLGRSESARLPEELGDLALTLHDEAPATPSRTADGTGADSPTDGGPGTADAPGPAQNDAPASGTAAEPTASTGPADPSEGARA
ncbi:cytochrome c biogenesis protein ResB [Streptomyces sp. NPDC059740]|uniref:cytochrome c biogenesis protein ResB n=1 Tax=Streptomyces sp. NPDC059740 TaxID=3346926 RepID=UPI00364EEA26